MTKTLFLSSKYSFLSIHGLVWSENPNHNHSDLDVVATCQGDAGPGPGDNLQQQKRKTKSKLKNRPSSSWYEIVNLVNVSISRPRNLYHVAVCCGRVDYAMPRTIFICTLLKNIFSNNNKLPNMIFF